MMKTLTSLIAAAAFNLPALAAGASTTPAETGSAETASANLTIEFSGIAEPKGQLMLAIFDSRDAYDERGKPVKSVMVPVDAATETVQVEGLAAGRYAFKLLHDVDGDGKMATNPFGMPTEPFAFSNNARGNMGPAKWDAASFDVAGATTQHIAFR
jgi:uncharacterized protein (DUF2141 family)